MLLEASLYVYIIVVSPTGKKSLGLYVLDTKKKLPELSVTVGRVHDSCLPKLPVGTSELKSAGQVTTGGVESNESAAKKVV